MNELQRLCNRNIDFIKLNWQQIEERSKTEALQKQINHSLRNACLCKNLPTVAKNALSYSARSQATHKTLPSIAVNNLECAILRHEVSPALEKVPCVRVCTYN